MSDTREGCRKDRQFFLPFKDAGRGKNMYMRLAHTDGFLRRAKKYHHFLHFQANYFYT